MNSNLNLNVRGLRPSSTLAINERSDELRQQGRRVFKLGLGQSPFPVPLPVVESLRANAFQKEYQAVRGLHELRGAVAEYQRGLHQIPCTAEDVLVGPGSKELMFLVQLVYYGDLIIPTPSWVSYAPQAQIIGRRVTWIPTLPESGWRLDADDLDRFCQADPSRPRILILNYPNNPTGLTYSAQELEAIAAVAVRYHIVLISDEIYGELHHTGGHVSIARYCPERTIISTGLSKWCGAGGWRLGTFTFPRSMRWLLDSMAVVASETFTSTSAPIQYAAVRAFQGGIEIEHYLVRARRILQALGQYCANRLEAAGVSVCKPQGGFYLFPDFSPHAAMLRGRQIHTSEQLCERVLNETGVAMLPGSDFGRPAEEFTVRIAYVDFNGGHCLTAADAVPSDQPLDDAFLERHCGNVTMAVNLIGDWVAGG
ncbi:MAG: aminotransferase class I/II-fold pyridoxal phosphate-dependent enzyme [Bryobacterales bacterium]|jgi:aspartate aminotransferase|nr:aminotransferase class I/II-fold pyridoxal phosphate-dependent enzyme [Bryobacterales bacterium]